MSRSGLKSDRSKAIAEELKDLEININIVACDISNYQELELTLYKCSQDMPPIRGVIQGAMVLKVKIYLSCMKEDIR
jgi:KR domain